MSHTEIVIRGAREHNLRNIDLRLPRNRLICMTGVSGSGKSSLAFDTLYAEGQRRYVESLSSYARQFLGQMPRPEVDSITGIAPSISIQQKTAGRNPRSTVGTMTEVYDYLRVLFARVGTGHCPRCWREITAQTTEQIVGHLLQIPAKTRYLVLAPLIQQQKGEYRDLFEDLLKQGYLRARVDGRVVSLSDDLRLDRQMRHNIEVVVDRLSGGTTSRSRVTEAVEQALRLSGGSLIAAVPSEAGPAKNRAERDSPEGEGSSPEFADRLFSSQYACTHCGLSFEPPSPQLFSFNSPLGMCLECNGLGMRHDFLLDLLIPDEKKSLNKGAVELLGPVTKMGRWKKHIFKGVAAAIETDLGLAEGSVLKTAWKDLPEAARELLLYGLGERHITFSWRYSGGVWKHGGTYAGIVADLLENYRTTRNPMRRKQLEKYMQFVHCGSCGGTRLNSQAQAVRVTTTSEAFASQHERTALSLSEVCGLSIRDAAEFFESLALDETGQYIAVEALREIRGRLGFLLRCGLDYLTLDRTAPTLSGGESQRIRLAGQIGCGLVGVVYILDEPSIGLHPRDNVLLLESLKDLRDQGNTVIVVEHDEDTMRAADHLVDFGPGPGVRGGEVVAEGSLAHIQQEARSLTGQYLSGSLQIATPVERRKPVRTRQLRIKGATHNNLQKVDAAFPLGTFICVTGVSGSGKSSLVNDILWQVLNRDVNGGNGSPGAHRKITGLEHIDKAIDIDQSPIGRTPRSNPATYVKLFDEIRKLYTQLPESRIRGWQPGRFSFNVADGRCEACEGHGSNRLEMDFLADIWVTCPVCRGRRFNHETLEVRYRGRSIADVLNMDIQEALEHFENHPKIARLLQTLHDVGLDYLKLGQASPTLSGGEAQRIKLARELGKRSTGKTIYLLDEPTTGLHFADVAKLLDVLHGFVEAGNTVLVIEHNLDVIRTADWVIDLGPDGGSGGGTIVAEGPPEDIAACEESFTGRALAKAFADNEALTGTTRKKKPRRKKKTAAASGNGNGATTQLAALSPEGSDATGRFPAELVAAQHGNGNGGTGRGLQDRIIVRGAGQHNLQQVDLDIPRDKMNVFCGPSGSGKTSLAMDTLYAEGQRRYVESLSAYARQFLGQMPRPRVEHIHGLSPSIAIEQKSVGTTPRSTVGTVTEIYDYLRILFARLGTPYCPDCHLPVRTQTTDEVIDRVCSMPAGTRLLLLAPQEVTVGQKYDALWQKLRDQGFLRVRIDGETCRLDDIPEMDRRRRHTVEVVVDRVTIKGDENRSRVADSVEAALELGRGLLRVATVDPERPEAAWATERYSLHFACSQCGRGFEELTPHQFSFNSPLGWCEDCEGLGVGHGTSTDFLIADKRRSLREGAISAWPDPATTPQFERMLEAISAELKLPLDVPMQELSREQLRLIASGTGDRWFTLRRVDAEGPSSAKPKKRTRRKKTAAANPDVEFQFQYKGLLPAMEEAARVSYAHRQKLQDLTGEVACPSCGGSRLKDVASAVRFRGKTIAELCDLPLSESFELLQSVRLDTREKRIAGDLLEEATSRLSFLVEVGLTYLSLARTLPSLSGGEMQRIRLAGQIGRALTGVLYVLDEPTIGLHPRDNARLLGALRRLRDLGNTLVLVEHDREVIDASDRLYDFGPGAGRLGGTVVSEGTPKQLARRKKSLTGQYLSGKKAIPIPLNRRMPGELTSQATGDVARRNALLEHVPPGGGWLQLLGARHHNLRDVDLRIPLGTLTCITGVSGSGKSSLIEQTLARALARKLHRANVTPAPHEDLVGLERINKVIVVDQQPLGSTPASNPATYTGVFDHIRQLFARLPESRVRGYTPARFSFNRAGGRCDDCEGNGQKCIEMHFLPDVWVECDTCHGRRYNQETLSVKYRGRSIADVLAMPIGEAVELFDNIPKIRGYLATLAAIGLDYLTLGQSAPTLSGGEAQRVKLASELARPGTGQTLYLLDEPTTGLHFDDIARLLDVLGSLVEAGNTVVVIEHNLDVIKTADWLIDLGPEAGSEGGWIVAEGTPEDIVAHAGRWQEQSAETSKPAKKPASRKRKAAKKKPATTAETTSTAQASLAAAAAAGLLRSHTGEMLAPVLSEGTRAEREVFDPEAARAKRKGDVDLSRIGKEAKMPWEADGPRWHCVDRIAHNGNPARWEGAALEHVIDLLAEQPGFNSRIELGEPDWNSRTVVEVGGPAKGDAWLLHAMTGDEWLLTLKFRVQKRTFDEATLDASLGLKPIDDLDEIQVYGRGPRVKVRNLKGPWQEVSISVHWLEEIDTPAFREFLETAVASFGRYLQLQQQDPSELMPWKKLGRKWHLMRKGFPSGKKIFWEAETLERLFDLVEELAPGHTVNWTGRTVVTFSPTANSSSQTDVRISTKRRGGIDLALLVEPGSIALGRIAALGHEREISQHSSGRDQVRLRFRRKTQVEQPELRAVLGEMLAAE